MNFNSNIKINLKTEKLNKTLDKFEKMSIFTPKV
jgi:hypothetical protein